MRPCVDGYASMAMRRWLCVDLGALEAATVIDVNRLPLGEELERTQACLAVAVAGAARAAEGQLDLRADGAGVDVDDAGRQVAHGGLHRVGVAREDAAGEAEPRVVIDGDGL